MAFSSLPSAHISRGRPQSWPQRSREMAIKKDPLSFCVSRLDARVSVVVQKVFRPGRNSGLQIAGFLNTYSADP